MSPSRALPVVALLAFFLSLPARGDDNAPSPRRTNTVDHDFGLSMPDPYRWMEGEGNAEFDAWLKTQGTASRAKLDALPTLETWRQRLGEAAGTGTTHADHRLVGARLFFMRAPAGKEAALTVREADGREHAIFDPNLEKGASISGYSVSPDGRKVAINIGHDGNEIGEVALYDAATGKRLGDTLKPVWSEVTVGWLPDGSGYYYTRMREPPGEDPMQGMGAYLHRLGEPLAKDTLIARAGAADALKIPISDFVGVEQPLGSDWALLGIGGARAYFRPCVAPTTDAVSGRAKWRCVAEDTDNIQAAVIHQDTLYLLQAAGAPNRRILALDLRDPEARIATAKVVVPERPDVVLSDISVARDALYVKSMRHGLDHVERLDYASHALTPVAMPIDGTIRLMRSDARQDGALLSLEGWTVPRKVYRYDPASSNLADTHLGAIGMREYPDVATEETEVTSADGTKVPLSLIYPKGLARNGSARAIVKGYGGYGISYQPSFNPVSLEWAKAGNVMATCHVRGGGENGDAWRIGGTGPNKQRAVEDFIACAQELAKRGFSAPQRTAGFGGSMGGILTGGAYTMAPDAWGAMVVQSGMFSATRLLAAKNGANQIPEMGDPRTPEGMRQLLAMDPYMHVVDGTRYPPLLLIVGLVDQRVAPWNSGKFGARVTAASPTTPVWYRTDAEFGHFATSLNANALEMADVYAFLDAQLKTP
jgi:prolyl oligopeptidase